MWPIVTDRVAWSVCRSVTVVSHAKMVEPIEMPFGLQGLWNHILQIPKWEGVILWAEGPAYCKV